MEPGNLRGVPSGMAEIRVSNGSLHEPRLDASSRCCGNRRIDSEQAIRPAPSGRREIVPPLSIAQNQFDHRRRARRRCRTHARPRLSRSGLTGLDTIPCKMTDLTPDVGLVACYQLWMAPGIQAARPPEILGADRRRSAR